MGIDHPDRAQRIQRQRLYGVAIPGRVFACSRRERADQSLDPRAHQRRHCDRGVLLGQLSALRGGGQALGQFGGKGCAKRQPRVIQAGIDRLGDQREGEPALPECARREGRDRSRERRQRARCRVGSSPPMSATRS